MDEFTQNWTDSILDRSGNPIHGPTSGVGPETSEPLDRLGSLLCDGRLSIGGLDAAAHLDSAKRQQRLTRSGPFSGNRNPIHLRGLGSVHHSDEQVVL